MNRSGPSSRPILDVAADRAIRSIPLLLLVGASLFLACGDDGTAVKPEPEPEPFPGTVVQDSLVFQRSDSTIIEMGTTPLVCCGLFDPGFVNEPAMRVVLYDSAFQKAGWQIIILTNRAVPGATTTLPTTVVPPSKIEHVSMFVTTALGGEWSSATEESSGSIVVHSFQCTSTTIRLDFSVDAILGSEVAGPSPIRARGTFRATFPAQSCP